VRFPTSTSANRGALEQRQRRVVADDLLGGRLHQRAVGEQALPLIAVDEQRPHAVADHVHRRLVAGVQQEDARPDQLVLRQLPEHEEPGHELR
jgi:hypothetical protein